MSDTVIRVENLSKQYRLGLIGGKTLRDDLHRWWAKLRGKSDPTLPVDHLSLINHQPFGNNGNNTPEKLEQTEDRENTLAAPNPSPIVRVPTNETVWALRNVSFEVKCGEILGIIGHNGAGKSTLLKILTRITAPTSGLAKMKGRVAALLEVGTGFHPELTGRENIFLTGTILGMTKVEVQQKLDEIVDFSGCDLYIDTPVKRYSSGMRVRLGFAVAAHLEPEILLVDEVLAVGDAAFQKKCLGKMDEVSKGGRTVLFVSHNLGMIRSLCERTMMFKEAQLILDGNTQDVITKYILPNDGLANGRVEKIWNEDRQPGNVNIKLKKIRIWQDGQSSPSIFESDKQTNIEFGIDVYKEYNEVALGFKINSIDGTTILHSSSIVSNSYVPPTIGSNKIICHLPPYFFKTGRYTLTVGADIPNIEIIFFEENTLAWEVVQSRGNKNKYSAESWKGYIDPSIAQWEF